LTAGDEVTMMSAGQGGTRLSPCPEVDMTEPNRPTTGSTRRRGRRLLLGVLTGALAVSGLTAAQATAGPDGLSARPQLTTGKAPTPTTRSVPAEAGSSAGTTFTVAAPVGAAAARTKPNRSHDVIANLWEWNWRSVAAECAYVLGPSGYGGVQVAPPTDSLSRTVTDPDNPVLHPWWDVYQPASYSLDSRLGTTAQFKAMVSTCRKAGVRVYVDAVLNHMTGQGSVSYSGRSFSHYSYLGLYGPGDFHAGSGDCPSTSGGIENYNDPQQVWTCELLGLADLRTDSPAVRKKLAAYLNTLIGYGVSGFRVDAAKHIGEDDLRAIRSMLHRTVDGDRPYFALEVIPGGPGVLTPQAFTRAGTPLGFDFAYQVKNAFKSYTTPGVGAISSLRVFGEDAGLLPSTKTLVFVQNHDTERGTDTLSYKDGKTNVIAHQFMLAYGYGRPQVYSAFSFTNRYDSPPATAAGFVTNTDCATGWVCVDRYQAVVNLVRFHNYVGSAPLRHWYDDRANLIAFSRGSRGWIAINNADRPVTRTFRTGLRKGTYCDVSHGTYRSGTCSGPTVRVDSRGRARVTVPAKEAVAFATSDRVQP
jgi:alpha-amylase